MSKVLLVDDDSALVKIYTEKLQLAGFEVAAVDSGEKAMTTLTETPVDLILLDIMIAGKMNGFDVLEKLKKDEKYSQIPVIVLTNLDSEAKVAKEIGAQGYLIKANTDLNALIDKIKSLVK